RSKRATVIVQNPNTGAILAMANMPDFTPGQPIADLSLLRNRAVSDVFEPGSTFKIIPFAGAFEEEVININDTFPTGTNGRFRIFGHTIRDVSIIRGGATPRVIMERSSNIGTLHIAQQLGRERFYDYIRRFGFNNISGIDLPAEARGILADHTRWCGLSLPNISFGQGIAVTPLQLINSFSAIANGGVLMRPHIVKSIETTAGERIYMEPMQIRRVISSETSELMRDILKTSSGPTAQVRGFSVAGKTGTAQKPCPRTGRYMARTYISSFCGFVPAKNPQVTILVILDEPQGEFFASVIVSPVFARMAEQIVQYLNLTPDLASAPVPRRVA
ncbi:MAG: penicillin-binding protein 2, partial [Elusimicrobia bacterium]|nr:penicillin-binding protein 2 [Elusimicrobiota bacterium]